VKDGFFRISYFEKFKTQFIPYSVLRIFRIASKFNFVKQQTYIETTENDQKLVSKYSKCVEYLEHVFSVLCIPYFPYRVIMEFIFCVPTRILIKNLITSLEVRTLISIEL